ncbi:hypothetical protein [Streptomyces sp. NPDC001975]
MNVDSTVCRAHQHAAGVSKRGDLQKERPGGPPRERPRAAFESEREDSHSPSWISWAELEEADWDGTESSAGPSAAETRLSRRQVVRDEDWGDVWSVMAVLAKRHGAENVRLVVWFDN